MAGATPFVGSFQAMSSPLLSSVLSSPSALPSPWSSSSSSHVVIFLLSAAVLLGHVTGAPKGYDYDAYDDDPYNGLNIIKVNKVVDYYSKPQYAFGYEVDDYYNQLSHGRWEIRDGDVTQGQYRVLLPDGRIQIVSYIADKNGYRPTVEYIGKGVHPPPPPAYAHVKIPQILETAAAPLVKPVVQALPVLDTPVVQPIVHPTAVPYPVLTASAVPHLKAPLGVGIAAAPIQEYNPVKIKLNSLPVNGPLPIVDPYAIGYGYYGLDPAFAGSNNVNKISRKRALLYDRTLFRKDVEKRAATKRKILKPEN